MNTADISILRDIQELDAVLPPEHGAIRTSPSVAQVYTLPPENVVPSMTISAEDHAADVHDVRGNERILVLEDLASFCTLLCAVDEEGNASMLHAPLIAMNKAVSKPSVALLLAFRQRLTAVLRGRATVVASGMRGNWGPTIAACVREIFAETHDLVFQLSGNPGKKNALTSESIDETYSGMLFVPPAASHHGRSALFLLEAHTRVALAPRLGGTSARYKPRYETAATHA